MAGYQLFTVGQVLTQADLQQYLVNGPYVELQRSTAQTISNNTATDMSWTVENSDRQNLFSATSTTFTVATGYTGVWRISSFARFDVNATSFRVLAILKNGAALSEWRGVANSVGGQPTSMNTDTDALLIVGDTIKINVFQLSGGNLDIVTTIVPRVTLTRLSD